MEPPYLRIKLCRAGKSNLSIFILRLLTSGMSLAESPSFYLISFCHRISKKKKTIALSWLHIQPGDGGRAGSQDFKWQGWSNGGKNQNIPKSLGLQVKCRKIPGPKFHPSEIPSWMFEPNNLLAELRGRDTWELSPIFRLFWIPPKNTCQNFPTKKYPEIENVKPQKTFDHPCRLKSGVPSPPGQKAF